MKRTTMIAILAIAIPAMLAAEWIHSETEDMMAGTVSRVALMAAEAYQGTLSTPYLVLRNTGTEYDVYVSWGGYTMDRKTRNALVRFGAGDVQAWSVTLSTDLEATFVDDWGRFISAMLDADAVVIQAERATGVMSVARWQLVDLEAALRVLDGE
jgi:hypothetical protein